MGGRACIRGMRMTVSNILGQLADGVSEDAVDGLIKRVRARLNEVPDGGRYLSNVRGRGLTLRKANDSR